MIHRPLIDDEQEFVVLVRGRYGRDGQASVQVFNKNDRPEKQRAEVVRLVADLLYWAKERGVTVETVDDGYVVRG